MFLKLCICALISSVICGSYDSRDNRPQYHDEYVPAFKVLNLLNWGGNFRFSTQNIQYPKSSAEVQKLIRNNYYSRMRPLGTRHSFNRIADSYDMLVSTSHMNQILGVDINVPSITIEAGMTYTDLVPFIESLGAALPNLAGSAEVSVAGAAQTATHGSGVTNKILANDIIGLQLALANGTLVNITQENPDLKAIAVGLGAFGIITEVTLKLEPTFQVATNVFLNLPIETLLANFDQIFSAAYTVQCSLDFSNTAFVQQVYISSRMDIPNGQIFLNASDFFGAPAATEQMTPVPIFPGTYVVEQLGQPGPWYTRLIDYRLGLSGFNGDEIQSEYFIPMANGPAAIQALMSLTSVIQPIIYFGGLRTVAADDFWMSHSFGQNSLVIQFTFKQDMEQVKKVLPQIEAVLLPFGAVPHWGKFFLMRPWQFLGRYQKFEDFRQLVYKYDPYGKFQNEFLANNVFV